MCLISRNKPKKATKDIVCYKVVYKVADKYYPLYIRRRGCYEQWPILIPDKTGWFQRLFIFHKKNESGNYTYGSGWIHAVRNLDAVKMIFKYHLKYDVGSGCTLCKCVIPEGTEYVTDDRDSSICAKQMRAVNIIRFWS